MFGGILGGYLMHGGVLAALWQPSELVIIIGAGLGSFMVANPVSMQKKAASMVARVFAGSPYGKKFFNSLFKMLFQLFDTAKKKGIAAVEDDIENPKESELFSAFPEIMKEERLMCFLTDTFRTTTMATISVHELDEAMESEYHTIEHEETTPGAAVQEMADAFPGFGIVAAVMGIVVTMQSMGGPVELIGEKVAAALVGTFVGILLCYGVVGPIASSMKSMGSDRLVAYQCIRYAMLNFQAGRPPLLALDAARRILDDHIRPSFNELEELIKGGEGE